MKGTELLLACALVSASLSSFLSPRTCASVQENPLASSTPRDLADLELSSALRLDLQDALNRRDYKRAEKILVAEVEHDPKSPRAAKLLVAAAGVFFLDGQYLNAAIAWKRAEAIAPLDDRSRFTLAMAYIKLNRPTWARSELEKLTAANPQEPLYVYWLARLDYDARNYTSALSGLQKAIELDPKMMRAYNLLGLCYDYQGQFGEAVKNYNRAVELNRLQTKPSPWPNLDLAITLISQNQLEEAEKNMREALGYDARIPQAHYQLGRILEMQGSYPAAVNSLKQATALDPGYPEPHYLLGRIYHRLGSDAVAKAEMERYQELKKAGETGLASKPSPLPQM